MTAFFNSLFNWFIPLEIQNDERRFSKAKMTVGIGLMLGFVVMLQSIRSLLTGAFSTALIIVVFSLLVMGGPLLMKKTRSITVAANLTITVLFALCFLIVLMRGGISSSIASYLAMVPFCALMMSGLRAGIFWGIISIGAAFSAYLIKRMGVELPEQNMTPQGLQTYLLITYGSLILFSTILGSIFESVSNSNFNRFITAQEKTAEVIGNMKQAIENVDRVMQSIAGNDLSQRVEYRIEGELDQLKDSVNGAIDLLSETIQGVVVASGQIDNRADHLAASAKTLAEGTSTQAASIEQISSSMGEVDRISRENNNHASQSRSITRETLTSVKRGNEQVNKMVETMNRIAESGQNINKIVKVIDEIAFQTNLLALNAAVEAARAGKYGKGFAVVAEEVRNLAGKSAEAAKDTTSLIDRTIKEIEGGVENVNLTADMLSEISGSMDQVTELIGQIADGSDIQRAGIEEITKGLEQVNRVVQQNASISEKTADSSGELKEQSLQMQNTMQQFILLKDPGASVGPNFTQQALLLESNQPKP